MSWSARMKSISNFSNLDSLTYLEKQSGKINLPALLYILNDYSIPLERTIVIYYPDWESGSIFNSAVLEHGIIPVPIFNHWFLKELFPANLAIDPNWCSIRIN